LRGVGRGRDGDIIAASALLGAEIESLLRLGLDGLRRRYLSRELSAVEVIDAVAVRIERTQPELNAFVTLCLDRARAEAEVADRRLAEGSERPLEGIPIAVKDLLDTEGVRTSYGSSMFASHIPGQDAVAVRRAREAGAIVVGKSATHEFAWGITSDNPHYGACRNPWDPVRIAGGSSGGPAAALAAGVVPLALASDTGGSIRIPAAFCGVVGFKPGYGRVSTAGVFPLAPSLDHVGPMATRPSDAWRLYEAIAAPGRLPRPGSGADLPGKPDPVRIGTCPDLHGIELADDVDRVLTDSIACMERLGAGVVECEFPSTAPILPTFATIQGAEAHATHRRRALFPDRSPEYGDDVRERLERAARIDLGDYLDASAARAGIEAAFTSLFNQVDLLLTPVCAAGPVLVGQTTSIHHGRETDFRDLVMGATTPQNLAGLPTCTVRAGFGSGGLPVGLQLTGPRGAERRVVATAQRLFDATPSIQNRWPGHS
jgi:aspartyl-tRNA(Asn)/glutamyl-tRNA(Gln) amidotransferase subunit A